MQMQALPSTSATSHVFNPSEASTSSAGTHLQAAGHSVAVKEIFAHAGDAIAATAICVPAPKAQEATRDVENPNVPAAAQLASKGIGNQASHPVGNKAVIKEGACSCFEETIACIGTAVVSFIASYCAVTCALENHVEV